MCVGRGQGSTLVVPSLVSYCWLMSGPGMWAVHVSSHSKCHQVWWLSSPCLDCLVDSLTLLYFDRALVKCWLWRTKSQACRWDNSSYRPTESITKLKSFRLDGVQSVCWPHQSSWTEDSKYESDGHSFINSLRRYGVWGCCAIHPSIPNDPPNTKLWWIFNSSMLCTATG